MGWGYCYIGNTGQSDHDDRFFFYPNKTKSQEAVESSIKHFFTGEEMKAVQQHGLLYSDNANEIKAASNKLEFQRDPSVTYTPQTNSIAESSIK